MATTDETLPGRSPEAQADEPMDDAPTDATPSKPEEKAASSPDSSTQSKKRSAPSSEPNGAAKATKRRAARACISCRSRKVRCDVVEGAPCGNCRWDNVECIVQESRRRRKNLFHSNPAASQSNSAPQPAEAQLRAKPPNPVTIAAATAAAPLRRPSEGAQLSPVSNDVASSAAILDGGLESHVPHLLYQRSGLRPDPVLLSNLQASNNGSRYPSIWPNPNTCQSANSAAGTGALRTAQFLNSLEEPDASSHLPGFIRPLPTKISPEDVSYLHTKGALSLPSPSLQNALLCSYIEYVHPYMPLLELHDFLAMVDSRDGLYGQASLFLYQSVMFAATAFVDVKYLKEAGYANRKAARRDFFYKARLLYDFDYECDRLILVQGLLLMTYWYETPDDQKDTWHWMGVAISLAHTIGLHRNPANTNMAPRKQKLWKRIWWSCFMRDRLIALGMRRPTRIKDEDFDVPMLDEHDFEVEPLADEIQVVGPECPLVRDVVMQQELALMCVAKAKLCLCISHMLKAQYSVLIRDKSRAENTTNSTMMLFPNKQFDNVESVNSCDLELMAWVQSLPACCQYRPLTALDIENGRATIAIQRNLLHMVYYTTISALHRPQFLPSSPMHAPRTSAQAQEMSRARVREAASQITLMVAELHQLRLEKYLPTTGVTVILPAMIIHLLEMKNPLPQPRKIAMGGFRQCMKVMEKLRDIYSAADYAVAFLDAALRKAAIDLQVAQTQGFGNSSFSVNGGGIKLTASPLTATGAAVENMATPPPENAPYATAQETNLFPMSSASASAAAAAAKQQQQLEQQQLQHHQQQQQFVPPADLVTPAAVHSPPHTEKEVLTPSASGSSDGPAAPLDVEMDFDTLDGHDEFDWNALTGTNIDFDQWLQFPGEGGKTAGAAVAGAGRPTMGEVDGPPSFTIGLLDGAAQGSGLAS
ncbi:fungal-specific transcription factor domain-containing protein [Durotheca rogersii]|uniref:fungal-specific transcription factor domain-containing protein n=1 Tax=Durotheca rogersii TaxID=419775 RepID=UPI00221F048A|nr:fungal-specific transcription factor domain-containing protein [Durotheca rogersii]KAI5865456.1 fungal-specific transcription factor domain-containing protein [Durotheca rogersii]